MTKPIQSFYDVVIVGGGIQGCAVAQAAQASGFTTLLLEKNDWASATSSRSSKLIHGGLRYLQNRTIWFSAGMPCGTGMDAESRSTIGQA